MIVRIYSFFARHRLATAIFVASFARIAIFAFTAVNPITNEIGMPVSPLVQQPWIEFQFYHRSLETYQTLSAREISGLFVAFFGPDGEATHVIGGPVFPFLIGIFDYVEGNTLPLASFYLALSILLCVAWLKFLSNKGVGLIWLLGFALLPNPFWFMLNVTTDLIFAVLVMIFYFSYWRERWSARDVSIWVTVMILCVLTRPNGAAILLFVFLDFIFLARVSNRARAIAVVLLGVTGLIAAAYLSPYFITELKKVTVFRYFGIAEGQYHVGLYETLPGFLDVPLSWLSLIGAKFLYFVGLRPSDSGVGSIWVLIRASAGIVLLPGMIYLAFRGERRDCIFFWIFFIPVLLGPTQERYNLAIQPLLFFYGFLVYRGVWQSMVQRFVEPMTRPRPN